MKGNLSWFGLSWSSLATILAAGILLSTAGCGGVARGLRDPATAVRELPSQIVPGRKEATLRKKVEADHFPTAQEAGIQ